MSPTQRCPNGCGGEVPLTVEWTDDGAADVYGPRSYRVAWIDDEANAKSHEPQCPPLTEAQREEVEQRATFALADEYDDE